MSFFWGREDDGFYFILSFVIFKLFNFYFHEIFFIELCYIYIFFSFCFLFFSSTHILRNRFASSSLKATCQSFCFLGTVVIGQSLIAIARASFVNQIPSNFRCLAAVSEVIRIKLFDRDTSMCWEHTGHWQENRSMKHGWEKKEIEKSVRERQLIGCLARIAAWKVWELFRPRQVNFSRPSRIKTNNVTWNMPRWRKENY